MDESELRLAIPEGADMALFCGSADSNLRAIEEIFGVTVSVHADQVVVSGNTTEIPTISSLITEMFNAVEEGGSLTVDDIRRFAQVLRTSEYSPSFLRDDTIFAYRGRTVRPKTSGQKRYCDAIRSHSVTFGIGPAGTGKTFLAMAVALAALQRHEISRIILSRPVVEAGESLGFLPGTLMEKVDPYVRPLYDALFDLTDPDKGHQLINDGVIEIVPLAFMRGRTFNDAFLILDEAQNATAVQLKMFLTRLGFGSHAIVTGDVTQSDLPHGMSGLAGAESILGGIDEIAFVHLEGSDVVRHSLVSRIIEAYESAYKRAEAEEGQS
ncbi:MAG: PhoH family protein [Coriobacteriales bacterium]|jgi:phosphate starvation-inducible PhoH-like protein